MNEARKIRFDRRIDIEWLDLIAPLVAENTDGCHISSRLFEMLGATLSAGGSSERLTTRQLVSSIEPR